MNPRLEQVALAVAWAIGVGCLLAAGWLAARRPRLN